ncbi:MAG: class I SAM-dependent methyltransferase [Verrucomicrobiota bacterium]
MSFPRATEMAQTWIRERVQPGAFVVDATTGNGHDTVFLAELVGRDGKVIAFDIQAEALRSARARLDEVGLIQQVSLIHAGHERMAEFIHQADAVMFNLGYLPGSDKSVITQAKTTIAALKSALQLLNPGGIVTVVAYPGHEGGSNEAEAVVEWSRGLDPEKLRVARFETLNPTRAAPFAIGIERT